MAFSKVTVSASEGITPLADVPGISANDLKKKFDELPNKAINGFNNHIDELEAPTGASSIGAMVPSTIKAEANLQSIINATANEASTAMTNSHNHSNKSTLDLITAEEKVGWDRIASMLATVFSVQNLIESSDAAIPTSKAVADYIASYDFRKKIVNTAYPVGSVYFNVSTASPMVAFGGTWKEVGIETINNIPIHVWRRTA